MLSERSFVVFQKYFLQQNQKLDIQILQVVKTLLQCDQQGISSEGHALVVQDKGDTAWSVARAGSSLQSLAGMQCIETVTRKPH